MRKTRFATLLVMIGAVPRAALACPVCFGQSDSPMAQGVNMGMYFLLAVVGGVLAAFASFFIYLARRARALAAVNEVNVSSTSSASGRREGTAQC